MEIFLVKHLKNVSNLRDLPTSKQRKILSQHAEKIRCQANFPVAYLKGIPKDEKFQKKLSEIGITTTESLFLLSEEQIRNITDKTLRRIVEKTWEILQQRKCLSKEAFEKNCHFKIPKKKKLGKLEQEILNGIKVFFPCLKKKNSAKEIAINSNLDLFVPTEKITIKQKAIIRSMRRKKIRIEAA